MQKSQIYTWDGKMPLRWRKLENFKLELPRDTLLSVEIVQELKGEVKKAAKLKLQSCSSEQGSVLNPEELHLSFVLLLIVM